MPSFEVTHSGANGLDVGAIVEADQCPAWLVGKCRAVQPRVLEVATPQRGRPRKEKEDD
jgi:hypothetical protein